MKLHIIEDENRGHSIMSSIHRITERTYALSDQRKISRKDLLYSVLSWRMVDLFRDKSSIDKLPPGFSIVSNVRGTSKNGDLLDDILNKHHREGSHYINNISYLTSQQHTKLHNILRNLFIQDLDSNSLIKSKIDSIYSEFVKTYEIKLTSYDYFGDRLKAYETALKDIALCIHDILSDRDYISTLYIRAENELKQL